MLIPVVPYSLNIRFYSDSGTTLLGAAGDAVSDDGAVTPGGMRRGTGGVVPEPSARPGGAVWMDGCAGIAAASNGRSGHEADPIFSGPARENISA